MRSKKAQAAIEFLMNYGWAFIVMIGVIAGVVVLDPISMVSDSSQSSSCTDTDLLECQNERVQVLSNGDIGLTYVNRGTNQLSFEKFNITSINGLEVENESCDTPITIPRGQTRTITCETNGGDTLVSGEQVDIEYQSRIYPSSLGTDYVNVVRGSVKSSVQDASATIIAGKTAPKHEFYEVSGTIVCDEANLGDTGIVDGVNYTAVSTTDLKNMDPSSDNYTKICTSHVTNMKEIFFAAGSFNQDIGSWDTSNVEDMNNLFRHADSFNQDIGSWNVSKVTDMNNMFYNAGSFAADISSWDTSNVQNMTEMFARADSFNADISGWDTSNVQDMRSIFYNADSFAVDISGWDTSSVKDMSGMFSSTNNFNADISGWDTSSAEDMSGMFSTSNFNQDIGGWDTSNVQDMTAMFWGGWFGSTPFDQDLSGWCVQQISSEPTRFNDGAVFEYDSAKQPKWGEAC